MLLAPQAIHCLDQGVVACAADQVRVLVAGVGEFQAARSAVRAGAAQQQSGALQSVSQADSA